MSKQFLFFLFFFLSATLIISGCSEKKCEKPFSLINNNCCVDLDNNQKCDINEQAEQEEQETTLVQESAVKVESKNQITGNAVIETKQQEAVSEIKTEQELTQETKEEIIIPVPEKTDLVNKTDEKSAAITIDTTDAPRSKTQRFIDMYVNQDKGYQYIYQNQEYKIKDDRIKLSLSSPKKYTSLSINGKQYSIFYIDTVYFDTRKQTATGFCERKSVCYEEEIFDIGLALDYFVYKTKTPNEWLYDYAPLEPALYEENKYYVKGRLTTRATYTIPQGELRIFYEPKIGLPIKIEKQAGYNAPEITEYFYLVSGLVDSEDVRHKTRKEISPADVFYTTRY